MSLSQSTQLQMYMYQYSDAESFVKENILCATEDTVLDFERPFTDYVLPHVNSPCILVRRSPRRRGQSGWHIEIVQADVNFLV